MNFPSSACLVLSLALISVLSVKFFLELEGVTEFVRTFDTSFVTPLELSKATTTTCSFPPCDTKHVNECKIHRDAELPPLLAVSDPKTSLVAYRGKSELKPLVFPYFFGGKMCQSIMGSDTTFQQHAKHSTIVIVRFNCYSLFQDMTGHGTGTFILIFYALRATAHAMGMTDVVIQCEDAEQHNDSLILPWLMGIFPRFAPDDPEKSAQPTVEDACIYADLMGPMQGAKVLGWIWNDMLFELRRMAIAMVGIPSPDHPSAAWAEKNLWSSTSIPGTHRRGRDYMQLPHPQKDHVPIYSDIALDEAVLHFRCYDLVNSAYPCMGFMKFSSFSRHISPQVRSIGIVTQPFELDAQQARNQQADQFIADRCKVLIAAFVEHLVQRFPSANVSVYNSASETISLTYARMIMANQTVVGISSFGVFPALASFGTGYVRHVDNDIYQWLVTPPVSKRLENVTLIPEPMIGPAEFNRLWDSNNGKDALAWFQNDAVQAPDHTITFGNC